MPDDQIFDQQTRSEIPTEPVPEHSSWAKFFTDKRVIAGIVVAILAIAGIFWFFLSQSNPGPGARSSNVILLLRGPSQLTSENEGEYTVVYRNGENADLVNVSLDMLYPSGFQFKSANPKSASGNGQSFNLPVLRPGESGEVVIRGKLSGATGEEKEIKARLHYRLSNFNSEFVVEQSIKTAILPPNLTLEVRGPVDVINGQDATFTVNYNNVSEQDFTDLALQLNYPEGFSFTRAEPEPSSGDDYWRLPELKSGLAGTITITGAFIGDTNQEKQVEASLGKVINNSFAPMVTSTAGFRIIPSSLNLKIEATPGATVELGETINYKLTYQNLGTIGLSNLNLTVNLDGPAYELSRISASNGIITGKTISWKAATYTNLAVLSPNEKGEVSFSVPVKQSHTTNLKNQTLSASASISSDEITQGTKAEPLVHKLATAMDLQISGGHVSGPSQLTVGQTTVIEINFVLSNLSNDIADTQVVASLPLPASSWKNVIIPESEKSRLTYDPSSGKITWKIGTLAAFVGRFTPALAASFQLAITPAEADRGKNMTLLSNVRTTGKDSFTEEFIETPNVGSVLVSDLKDAGLNANGGIVE